jgi:hypothetical protein
MRITITLPSGNQATGAGLTEARAVERLSLSLATLIDNGEEVAPVSLPFRSLADAERYVIDQPVTDEDEDNPAYMIQIIA